MLLSACGGSGGGGVVAPSALSYSNTAPTYTVGVAITANSPSSSGGAVTSYAVNPALPAGLTLNTVTGVISGTPTTASAATSYTVTASNTAGSTTAILSITVASAESVPFPDTEISYPGASATKPFTAIEPYNVMVQGVLTKVDIGSQSRGFDFSGTAPFINPVTGVRDVITMQAWDRALGKSVVISTAITNAGIPQSVEKQSINGVPVTMTRYNAGDGMTSGKARSQTGTFAIPSRAHIRWELEVAFGNADGTNDWDLTPATASPSAFWAISQYPCLNNGPINLTVDTDTLDPTKLMIFFAQRVGTETSLSRIAEVHGLQRHAFIPVVVEAFLDERPLASGGKGVLKLWVNDKLTYEKAQQTLGEGPCTAYSVLSNYSYNEPNPYPHTRAVFFKTARMLVYPAP